MNTHIDGCGCPAERHYAACAFLARETWPHPPATPIWARVDDVEVATVTATWAHFAGPAIIVFTDLPTPSFLPVDRIRLRETGAP